MALTELTALDDAYKALQPLGQAAQRRALQWLTDALIPGQILPDTPTKLDTITPETTAPEPTAPEPTATGVEPAVEPVAVVAPTRRRKPAAATSTPTPAASSGARGGRRVKGSAWPATVAGQRPYRRMPDPDTIMKAYRKVGTVSGLADRFDVPRHTVNHWARQLRNQGYDIGRTN
ncbi:MAG TPA: hypothetical protein VFC19_01775 [Candidatus Limnocylindrales bacterium]|nr:hypothetical protein [Candidatus Limnocylindrales bacterium]